MKKDLIEVLKANKNNIKGYSKKGKSIIIPVESFTNIHGFDIEEVEQLIKDVEDGKVELIKVYLMNGESIS